MPIAPLAYVMKGVINTPPYEDVTWKVYGTPDLTGAQSGYTNLINILVDYIIEDELAGTQAVQVEEQVFLTGDAYGPSNNNVVTMTGDVTGRTSANTITKLQGNPISAANPLLDETLMWNGSTWVPATITTQAAGGDLSGTYPNPLVINGHFTGFSFTAGATTTTRTVYVEDNNSLGTLRTHLSIIGQFGGNAADAHNTTSGGNINITAGAGGIRYPNPLQSSSGSNGGAINITGGAGGIGSTSITGVPSIGGQINITGGAGGTGDVGSNGGDVNITGGTVTTGMPTPCRGGNINITGGVGESAGGNIVLTGAANTSGQGGNINITGGNGFVSSGSGGGNITIHAGDNQISELTNGGHIFISGGNDLWDAASGGNVTISGGGITDVPHLTGTLTGGHLYLQGGASNGGLPGHVYIDGGKSQIGNPNRGEVRIGTVAGAAKVHIKSIGTDSDALFLESDGYAAITVGSNKNITLAWASSPGTGRIDLSNISTATSASAGSNGDVPGQVVGYINIIIGGNPYKIPYYNT